MKKYALIIFLLVAVFTSNAQHTPFRFIHISDTVMEIGCGGGDNLRVIKKYCEKRNIPVQLIGVDLNPHCINFAKSRESNRGIDFITSDYRLVAPDPKPDIIFSSLFCHHFDDEGVMEILTWMKTNAETGFFINDLHRHTFAYYSIKWLTGLFSKSYLVKNDAPLSVLRGFSRAEWERFIEHCSIKNTHITWRWAFRWLIFYHD